MKYFLLLITMCWCQISFAQTDTIYTEQINDTTWMTTSIRYNADGVWVNHNRTFFDFTRLVDNLYYKATNAEQEVLTVKTDLNRLEKQLRESKRDIKKVNGLTYVEMINEKNKHQLYGNWKLKVDGEVYKLTVSEKLIITEKFAKKKAKIKYIGLETIQLSPRGANSLLEDEIVFEKNYANGNFKTPKGVTPKMVLSRR